MAKDITKIIALMTKAHDYYGKAKEIYDPLEKVYKASQIAVGDLQSLRELFGTGYRAKDIENLVLRLDKRAKTVDGASRAVFPEIKTYTLKMWVRWAEALDKNGESSPETAKARKAYLKSLLDFDQNLCDRLRYCAVIVKTSEKQAKIYKGLAAYVKKVMYVCYKLLNLPAIFGSAHQAEALNMHENLEPMGPAAQRLMLAHKRLITTAKAEIRRVKKIQKENDKYIENIRRTDLNNFLKAALKAFGVETV